MLNRLSLRFSLTLGIVVMGLLGIVLSLYIGDTYRKLAMESQRLAYKDIVSLRVGDLLSELQKYSRDLGQAVQNNQDLRKDLSSGDQSRVTQYLSAQFHQYFVTAGVLRLNSLIAHDAADFHVIGQSWDETFKGVAARSCPDIMTRAIQREGANRLQVLAELCLTDGYPFYHVLIPIGGFRIRGYLEIVTDPVHTLSALEKELGMPLKITLNDGEVAYRSSEWPLEELAAENTIASYNHRTGNGGQAFQVSVVRNNKVFLNELHKTQSALTMTAGVVVVVLALLMVLFVKRTTLTPLQILRLHLEQLQKDSAFLGQTVTPTGNSDVRHLAEGFNAMTTRLRVLYDEIRQTNDELVAEVAERKYAESQLKQNQDNLEELVENRTADLAIARDQALSASKAKSQFLANMSHELRTPLNAIIGYSEILLEDAVGDGNQTVAGDLRKVLSAGVHLLSLINDILDLSKIEAGKVELTLMDFGLRPVISDVINTITPDVERNKNQLVVECQENIGTMHADPIKIRQCLLNLLSNAAKFTSNGTIWLRVRRVKKPRMPASIEFEVEDSGIGLAQEVLDRIFKPFSQADNSMTRQYGGTGLGLTITRNYCRMMNGDVVAEGRAKKGAIFIIRLPEVVIVDKERKTMVSASISMAGGE